MDYLTHLMISGGLGEQRSQIATTVLQLASTSDDGKERSYCSDPTEACLPSISYLAVSQLLLSKINRVQSLTQKEDIPTANVTALLEILSKAYKYSYSVTQSWFSLGEACVQALDDCDAAFRRFLSSRMAEDEKQAKKELKTSERFAGGLTSIRLQQLTYY